MIPRAGGLCERAHELAADDEGLLVGESKVDPLAERRDTSARPAGPTIAFRTRSAPESTTSLTRPSAPLSTSPSVHASDACAAACSPTRAIRRTP